MTIENTFKDKINWKSFNMLLDIVTSFEDSGNEIILDICTLDRMGTPNCLCYYTTDAGFRWFVIRDFLADSYLKEFNKGGVIYRVQTVNPEITDNIKEKILSTGKYECVKGLRGTINYYKDK